MICVFGVFLLKKFFFIPYHKIILLHLQIMLVVTSLILGSLIPPEVLLCIV